MRMCAYLEAQGIDTKRAQRVSWQVEKLARTATILNALDVVFNTTHVFHDVDKVFEMRDMLEVDVYMQCTEEIVWDRFQLLGDQYVDVDDARSVVALAKSACRYDPTRPVLAGEGDGPAPVFCDEGRRRGGGERGAGL